MKTLTSLRQSLEPPKTQNLKYVLDKKTKDFSALYSFIGERLSVPQNILFKSTQNNFAQNSPCFLKEPLSNFLKGIEIQRSTPTGKTMFKISKEKTLVNLKNSTELDKSLYKRLVFFTIEQIMKSI